MVLKNYGPFYGVSSSQIKLRFLFGELSTTSFRLLSIWLGVGFIAQVATSFVKMVLNLHCMQLYNVKRPKVGGLECSFGLQFLACWLIPIWWRFPLIFLSKTSLFGVLQLDFYGLIVIRWCIRVMVNWWGTF